MAKEREEEHSGGKNGFHLLQRPGDEEVQGMFLELNLEICHLVLSFLQGYPPYFPMPPLQGYRGIQGSCEKNGNVYSLFLMSFNFLLIDSLFILTTKIY